jgi:hypothetical protein
VKRPPPWVTGPPVLGRLPRTLKVMTAQHLDLSIQLVVHSCNIMLSVFEMVLNGPYSPSSPFYFLHFNLLSIAETCEGLKLSIPFRFPEEFEVLHCSIYWSIHPYYLVWLPPTLVKNGLSLA